MEFWEALWCTLQAAGWAGQAWRWQELGNFVRLSVRMEATDSPPSLMTPWLRMRTELGLSPAGLKENGWQIAAAPIEAKTADRPVNVVAMPERRLRG